jgi:hypothetical protein
MSTPAQVSEAHRALAREIMFNHTPGASACAQGIRCAAQLIADSEAKACAWALWATTCTHHNDKQRAECPVCLVATLTTERDQLRAEFEKLTLITAEAQDRNVSLRLDADQLRAEAKSCGELSCDECNARTAALIVERGQLRAIFPQICEALGNGACCAPDVSLDFLQSIPNEVACVVAKLRAEVDAIEEWKKQHGDPAKDMAQLRAQRDALLEIAWLDTPDEPHETATQWRVEFGKGWERKSVCDQLRAERNNLHAELERLRDGGVQRIKDAMAFIMDERDSFKARAESAEREVEQLKRFSSRTAIAEHRAARAEADNDDIRERALTLANSLDVARAELKAYRDAVDAQPWASDLPIRVLLDQITSELLTTRNLLMADTEAQAELAAERARLDAVVANCWAVHSEAVGWFSVFSNACGDYIATAQTYRAAIDAAMKEDTK